MTTANSASDSVSTDAVRQVVAEIVGLRAWGVALGLGSFLTISFGEADAAAEAGSARGEWYLWAYQCAWRLDRDEEALCASEDERGLIRSSVAELEDRAIRSFDVTATQDATIAFDGALVLRFFPVHARERRHWMLWRPGGRVVIAGPGSSWHDAAADEPLA